MKKTIFFIVITAIVLSAFFSTVSFAESEKPELYDASTELDAISCGFGYFYYSDDMLLNRIGSDEPSGELALASVAMANDAYEYNHIYASLEMMHFNELYRSKYYDEMTTHEDNDVVAYTIAEKYVRYNNQLYRIIIVPIRGTPETCEWYSDFDMGEGEEHFGFKTAAWKVLGKLAECVYEPAYDVDHTVIWTMGHSRGAAVANIVAGKISTGEAMSDVLSSDYVFGYTFACPAVSRSADTSLQNIYNYNNPGDMVPQMPLSDWGFKRFGQTIELPASDYDNLCQRYKAETGEDYKATMTTVDHVEVLKNVAPTQDKFVNDDKIQLAVDMVAWFLGGKSDSEYDLLDVWISHPSARAEIDGAIIKTALAPKSTLNAMAADLTVADLQLMMDSDLRNYLTLETELRQAITETSTMSDVDSEDEETHRKYVEWCNWKNSHSGLISEAEDMTNVVIEKKIDISSAHTAAGERYEDYNEIASTIRDILSLFYDTEGNPAAAFSQGHPQNTYVLWINSMYYGYKGWYENPSITVVNWTDRNQNSYAGRECFSKCNNITSVVVPNTIKTIGHSAFQECDNLESVVINGNVDIGNNAFCGNEKLESVQFNGRNISIGYAAFANCTAIKRMVIPDSVKKIYSYAFNGCTSLTDLTAPYDPDCYDDSDGDYGYSVPTVLSMFINCPIKHLTITKGKTDDYYDTPYHVLWDESRIECVTIADGVKGLGEEMFFHRYWALEKIELPSTLKHINNNAFRVRDTVSIDWARNINEVIYHGDIASWCSIDFADGDANPLLAGEAQLIVDGKELTDLVVPESITSVKPYAFYRCDGLKTVNVPESVRTIGGFVFAECDNLESVVINGNVDIGNNAFCGNEKLESVQFNGRNISIGYAAFADCTALKQLVIPDSVKKICSYAFYGCTSLTDLTAPYDPDCYDDSDGDYGYSVPTVLSMFVNCPIKHLTITKGKTDDYYDTPYHVLWSEDDISSVTIAEGVKGLGIDMFSHRYWNLEKIDLPSTMKRINANAFRTNYPVDFEAKHIKEVVYHGDIASWCSIDFAGEDANPLSSGGAKLIIGGKELTDLVVPDSITSVKPYSFYRCDGLTVITIPKSVKSIGISAFEGCDTVKDVYYLGSQSEWKSVDIKEGNDSLKSANIHFNETPIICNIHTWENKYTVDKEATCTEEGSESIHCSVCGAIKDNSSRTIEKKPHTPEVVKGKSATCTEAGLTDGKKCSVCGEIIEAQKEIAKLPHKLTHVALNKATDKKDGHIEYWCCANKDCGRCFNDDKGENEIIKEETVIPKNNFKVTVKKKLYVAKTKKKTTLVAKNLYKVTGKKGKVTYKKAGGNGKIKVSGSGDITVSKGLKKGSTYSVKVKVTTAANVQYKACIKTTIVKIKIK